MADFVLDWRGKAVKDQVGSASRKALLEAAADLQQISSDQAPVETGDLRGNASVDDANIGRGIVRVGYSLPYALRQHEEINYAHPLGGKAKFLEDPFRANIAKYKAHIWSSVLGAISKQ